MNIKKLVASFLAVTTMISVTACNNNEVAEILGISVNTVKSMKKSAYNVLRKYLDRDGLLLLCLLCDLPF